MPSSKIKEILENFEKKFLANDGTDEGYLGDVHTVNELEEDTMPALKSFLEKSLKEIEEATRMAIIGEIVKMPGWSDDYEKIIKKIQSQPTAQPEKHFSPFGSCDCPTPHTKSQLDK